MDVVLVCEPRVVLVAYTVPAFPAEDGYPFSGWVRTLPDAVGAEHLVEFAGRVCYQSWNRPNPATARTEDYIRNIVDHEHFSVLEHASFSVYIDGISRACSHQLVRHRHFSFSQLSHRFVRPDVLRIVVPPLYRHDPDAISQIQSVAEQAARVYSSLSARGKKVLNEAARAVLPHMVETALVMTGNLRSWREFFDKRLSLHADAEIREVASKCYDIASEIAPSVFPAREAALWRVESA